MMAYLEVLSDLCYERLKLRYKSVFTQIEKKREEMLVIEKNAMDGIGVEKLEWQFDRLEQELDEYLSDLLLFGFNSSSYDIPLVKNYLMKYLVDNE